MGSSGGGSSSGMVDFPVYMKNWHTSALGIIAVDPDTGALSGGLDITLIDAMNQALDGASPYAGFIGVSANDAMLGAGKVITDFTAPYITLAAYSALDIATLIDSFRNTNPVSAIALNIPALIDAITQAESDLLDSDINQTTLPAFQSGMRDINAIMGSAFVVGESIIRAQKAKALAKSDATLRFEGLKLQIDTTVKAEELNLRAAVAHGELRKAIVTMVGDFAKLYAVMRTELDNNNLEIVAKDRLWDLKTFQYGGNFLGSIAGSAVSTDKGDQGSKAMAIASTAIGVAAAGASIYSNIATGIASSAA
jgi:hypothetical protein